MGQQHTRARARGTMLWLLDTFSDYHIAALRLMSVSLVSRLAPSILTMNKTHRIRTHTAIPGGGSSRTVQGTIIGCRRGIRAERLYIFTYIHIYIHAHTHIHTHILTNIRASYITHIYTYLVEFLGAHLPENLLHSLLPLVVGEGVVLTRISCKKIPGKFETKCNGRAE